MRTSPRRFFDRRGFTLVEILVAVAILVILMTALSQILNVAAQLVGTGTKHLNADGEARLTFDRMASDLAAMPKRPDIDYYFSKTLSNGSDRFFFYSEGPGTIASTYITQNSASLIGYEINSSYQLQRLGYGLNWDQASGNATPLYSLTQLTFPGTATYPLYRPDPASTINDVAGSGWGSIVASTTSTNYHVLADMVFRLTYCFLLKDGTYSIKPVYASATSVANPPTVTSDASSNFTAGSLWWDTQYNRAYICVNPTTGAAVWRPLGWDDVAGVVVTMALLDGNSRVIVSKMSKTMAATAALFTDPVGNNTDLQATPPILPATAWQTTMNGAGFVGATGLPATVAAQIRIYQRCIYLNNLTNL
jgi:prepilin-type N-terminal cleavage/methylation domain-containing protein